MQPSDMEKGDTVHIYTESFKATEFRVSSVEVKDIGLTKLVAVGLMCGCDRYALSGTTTDSSFTLDHLDGESEWTVFATDIELAD